MKKAIMIVVVGLVCLFTVSTANQKQSLPARAADSIQPLKLSSVKLEADFGRMPLYFIGNKGQMDGRVDYYVQGKDKSLYFSPGGVTFILASAEASKEESAGKDLLGLKQKEAQHYSLISGDVAGDFVRESSGEGIKAAERWVVKLEFIGADRDVRPIGQDETQAVISYFKGNPEEWHTGLRTYGRLVYRNLWPGIDLVYSGTVNKLKYEFVVQPGADASRIKLAYSGASEVGLGEGGRLEVRTPLGNLRDDEPVAYQERGGERVDIPMSFALEGADQEETSYDGRDQAPELRSHAFGFKVGDYDRSLPLIMDPAILVYCGYIGGTGSERGLGIAIDESGNAYLTGHTSSTEATFPETVGPDLTYNGGTYDAFVAKVSASGTGLSYCGYIGGSGNDFGEGIAVDGSGNAYVIGYTGSTEDTFPEMLGPDLTFNGDVFDVFVAKINASGTGLVYCGYIGGSGNDRGYGIAVDGSGHAYVTGTTSSTEATFPEMVGPDLTHNNAGNDAFVAKVSASGTGLSYCGYIGGSGNDFGEGIAVGGSGNAYVIGHTSSTEATFPVTGGPDLTHNGGQDAFVAKINASGTGLSYCGYIGGVNDDRGHGIAVDGSGYAYVTGETNSTEATFPETGGPDLTFNGGTYDAYVAKVSASGTGLSYCGYIGGSGSDYGNSIAADGSGYAYVTGRTSSTEATFPETGGPDLTYNFGDDAFVAIINASGTGLACCGYIGGSGYDYGNGIAVDGSGYAYVTGETSSREATFPETGGPDLTFNGAADAFVVKISSVYPPSTPASPHPANGATGVLRNRTLTWSSTGATSYDVYGGPTSPPEKIATVITPSYPPGLLPALTKYYWKIVAINVNGATPGPLWSFTTGSVIHSVSAPTTPSGPSSNNIDTSCALTTGDSTCNLGHGVQYRFDWGDGQYSTYGSSSTSHSWSSYGTYSIRAQARCATDNNVVSSWSAIKTVNIAGGEFLSSGSWTGAGHGMDGWYIGDLNGDGKDDIFRYVAGTSGADVFLSDGTKFVHSGSWTGAGHGTDGWYVGDFNGDGKDDIFRYVPGTSGADVFLSSGTKFVYSGSWTGAGHGTDGWYVGDFNGDGRDDIFRYVPGTSGADVFLSDGTKFVYSGSWTGAGHGTDGWYVGDFNGDGKDDIFRYIVGTSGADVFLSDGIKFVYSGSWTGAGHGNDGWYVGDFNGDGKDDIFRYVSGVSGAQVYFSTGTAFAYMGSWTGAGHGTDGWYAGDFNGDLKADIFRYVPGTSGAEVFLSHFPISSLLFVSGEPILAFDEDMMLDIQGTRETKMSYQEEEEFLKPYFQRLMNGDEPTIYEIKSAFEERVGDRVRKIVVNQLLYRHDYWRLVEGFQRTQEER
jgi:hypothetical protein